ncbi:1,25-dihydroxyvitamin D(3) 24-hydroxylase, mitochondrial-like isoform X2 [Littorina saxatilis]|uniref:1,25-dihydroxyvitamin D(3) 24-hydroxylase, mitochondrial-like isoform X2 n=1 Tax=Littorina saxatilis TaxID=31220 RepID=UPI0038B456E9
MQSVMSGHVFRGVVLVARSKFIPRLTPLSGTRSQDQGPSRSSSDNLAQARAQSTLVTDKSRGKLTNKAKDAAAKTSTSQTLTPPEPVPPVFSRSASQQASGGGSAPGKSGVTGKGPPAGAPQAFTKIPPKPAPKAFTKVPPTGAAQPSITGSQTGQQFIPGLMPSDLTPKDVEGYLHAKPFEEIPGPTSLAQSIPYAGTRLLFYPFSSYKVENLGDMVSRMQAIYGSVFRAKMGQDWVVVIDNLQDIQHVVKAGQLEAERGVKPVVKRSLGVLEKFPKRIQDSSLSWWYGGPSHSKKCVQAIVHNLSSDTALSQILADEESMADDFVQGLDKMQSSPEHVQNLFYRFTFESVGQICYNQRLGLLSDNFLVDEQKQKLVESYRTVERCLTEAITGTRVLHMLFEDPFAKRFKEAQECVHSNEQALLLEATTAAPQGQGAGLLHKLLQDKTLDQTDIAESMHAIMTICGDGMASALQMTLYSLATNEDKQEKLVTELQKTLGPNFDLTLESIKSSEYLQAVIKESLRLHYPLPAGGNVCLDSNIVLNGFLVPAGTPIVINTTRTSRNPSLFDHPNQFSPERWLEGSAKNVPKVAYVPVGVKDSLGTFGLNLSLTHVAIVKILQQYKVDVIGGTPKHLDTVYTPFLSPKEPIPFAFTPRKAPGGKKKALPFEPPK